MRKITLFVCALLAVLFSVTNAVGAADEKENSQFAISNSYLEIAKIDRALMQAFQQGKHARALIVFAEQADLSGADALKTKKEKGQFVFEQLRAVAKRTQARVRAQLDAQGVTYRAFYVTNAIAVEKMDATLATQLATETNIARIASDPNVKFAAPIPEKTSAETTRAVEWGITKIGAPKLWQLKLRGRGIVVANQDTGVQWEHPALKKKYRGWKKETQTADHSYNWWDAIHSSIVGGGNSCGYSSPEPCDDYGHGTHTMGTQVGSTATNQIGVAPKARWIACRNMDEGVGRPSTYIECFEFFLAPWDSNGNNPDPNRAPDVVSNSWGCPPSELCEPDSLRQATRALRTAGIFISMSAGNSGSNCATITDPSSIYNASTTVGATNSNDDLASFSSRGPVTADDSNRRKPDVSAPGVNVRSSVPGGGYANLSGTSMAAPHVAGAVALLWQARPNLRGYIGETEKALFGSANRNVNAGNQICGGTNASVIPNNLFGYGRLDVWKAYENTQ